MPGMKMTTRISLLAAVFLATSIAHASSPSLRNVFPPGSQRGTELDITLTGARLSDAQEILFYDPGFQVTDLQATKDNEVKAHLKVAPDAALGEHPLRLRTASGISDLRTFYVGVYPVVDEKEPNNEFKTPQQIPLNVTITGVIQNEDVDYFTVDLKKGQRLNVEVEGMRLGRTTFDPFVAILDTNRFELTTSDDTALGLQDPIASIVAPYDGKYIIMLR